MFRLLPDKKLLTVGTGGRDRAKKRKMHQIGDGRLPRQAADDLPVYSRGAETDRSLCHNNQKLRMQGKADDGRVCIPAGGEKMSVKLKDLECSCGNGNVIETGEILSRKEEEGGYQVLQ